MRVDPQIDARRFVRCCTIEPMKPQVLPTPAAAPAASVLVLRPGAAGAEVLLVRRHQSQRLLAGYWVFPGGLVEAADADAPTSGTQKTQSNVPTSSYAAAARELFEETGLLIATFPVHLFQPWAHWITPSAAPRRFDTWFFVVAAPIGQTPRVDDTEVDAIRWIQPAEWSSGALRADYPITPPTQLVLRELARELEARGSVEKLLAHAPTRLVLTVLPKLDGGGNRNVVLPWDPEYDSVPGEGISWDAEAIAARRGWPSRLPASI
jgi:8-oxo-dGTP pyrophosphatase MutT (NUDIX family)